VGDARPDVRSSAGPVGRGILDQYAQVIGLDLVQFDADRSSPEIADEVAQDEALAASWAVYATPSFYIDGYWIVGSQPSRRSSK